MTLVPREGVLEVSREEELSNGSFETLEYEEL